MVTCPLCSQLVSQLKTNSHIIPEWMYKEEKVYDEKRRAIKFDFFKSKRTFIQKGYRGKIICSTCEQKTAELDSYASLFFKNRLSNTISFKKEKSILPTGKILHIWKDFDFKKIQNFIYSVCLRQHFYNISIYNQSLIVDKHLIPLLELYRSNKIDDQLYPILIIYLNEPEKLMTAPYIDKMCGHHVITFMTCSFQFIVKISSHSGEFWNQNNSSS